MKRQVLYFLLIMVVVTVLAGCSQDTEFELYEGKSLRIAVIGEAPKVKEDQVTFEEVSFAELKNDEMVSFDAVFVIEEKLVDASKGKYADIYLNSTIPFFFVSAKNHIPFTEKDIDYNKKSWGWEKGNSYVAGIVQSEKEETLKSFGFGLYNDKRTEEHIQATYSIVFNKIEEIDL